jgi:hypothetical protein
MRVANTRDEGWFDASALPPAKASVALSVAGPFSTLGDGFWLFALAADLLVQPNRRRSP